MSTLEEKIASYKPSDESIELLRSTQVLLLVGPTGAGKDSLKLKLLETGNYRHIVSHTTRPPRINHGITEKYGEDYYFIDSQTAENMIDNREFIEVKYYSGNIYGTSAKEISGDSGDSKIAVTDIEVQGVKEYKEIDENVMAVFLLPPDFTTWQKRLRHRYGDVVDVKDHIERLKTALNELNQLLSTNYYIAVVNDNLEDTFNYVQKVVNDKCLTNAEVEAMSVAKKLAEDIKHYLDENQ